MQVLAKLQETALQFTGECKAVKATLQTKAFRQRMEIPELIIIKLTAYCLSVTHLPLSHHSDKGEFDNLFYIQLLMVDVLKKRLDH